MSDKLKILTQYLTRAAVAARRAQPFTRAAGVSCPAQPSTRPVVNSRFGLSAGQWLAMTVLFGSGVAAFGLAPGTPQEDIPTQLVLRELANPIAKTQQSLENAQESAHYWREERIAHGDTLGSVFARLGVDDAEALAF